MQTIYLDIMVGGRFYKQLPYTYCPLWPVDTDEVHDFVVRNLPSLRNKTFNICFSNSKVI